MVVVSDEKIELLFGELVAERIGQQRYDRWFSSDVRFEFRGGELRVIVRTPLLCSWLSDRYRRVLEEICRSRLGRDVPVRFVTGEEKSPAPAASVSDEIVEVTTQPESIKIAKPQKTEPAKPKSRSSKKSSEQSFKRVYASYSTFVTGVSNHTAKGIADVAISSPGTLNPVFIYGPTSVGKTHLLEGVYSEYLKRNGRKTPRYLTSDEFFTQFVQGIQDRSGTNDFRARFANANLLIIEDLQNLERKEATQRELIHLIDTLQAKGVQMIFSADRPLADLTFLKAELLTRIESGIVCSIEVPERETLLKIFQQMARNRRLDIPEPVCRFVVSRFTAHARQLSGALNRLHAAHITGGTPFTVETASEILADLIPQRHQPVTLQEIEKAVSAIFNVSGKDLCGRSRSRLCTHPRMLAMWLARKYTRCALSEIGRHFGNRSHSTVVSAQKKVQQWLGSPDSSDFADALRRVERILATQRSGQPLSNE